MADDRDWDEEAEGGNPLPAFAQDPLGILRRRWIWMTLAVVLGLGATGVVVSMQEPSYVAETTILMARQSISEDFVRTTVVDDSLARINAIVGQVLSRQNLAELIKRYDLYPELRENAPLTQVVERMRSAIAIYPREGLGPSRRNTSTTQVFAISFEYASPRESADVANELAGFFTAANIEMRNRQASLTTDFLRRERDRAETELRDHERRITEFMQTHRGGLPGELQANIARLERLQSQRQMVAGQIDAAEGRLVMLQQRPEPVAAEGPTPRSLLADLRSRLEEQLVILTEEHPNIIALRRRIERLESEVVEEAEVEASSGPSSRELSIASEQRQLDRLRDQLVRIEQSIESLDNHVSETPMRQEEFAALEQRATVLRENYLSFLRKVEEAELAQSLESAQHGSRISVLDRASPPTAESAARWQLLGAGVLGAFGLAFAIAILLELVDAVVINRDHLEQLSDQPILGSIPRVA